jgi:hypothetical protein
VLPSPDHPVFRLAGTFTPSFPVPSAGEEKATTVARSRNGAGGTVRLQTGGDLRAPAIELVETAKAIGRLNELAGRVTAAPVDDNAPDRAVNQRGKSALLALIQIARGDDAAAAQTIESIKPLLEKIESDQADWARWPELAVASQAVIRPAIRPRAVALLDTLIEQSQKRTRTMEQRRAPSGFWEQWVKHVHARGELLAQHEKDEPGAALRFGADPGSSLWARVTPNRAGTRGNGQPIAHWSVDAGSAVHYPGHDQDMMYLTIPLRGDFQLDGELTSSPGREIRVVYSGVGVGLKADLKHVERIQLGRTPAEVALNPPLAKLPELYAFRLAVRGNHLTASIDGRKVHEAPVPPGGDPWLALLCPAKESGGARRITILGNPQVPEKLELSVLPDLSGWTAGEYDETLTGDNPDWDKRGEEIIGRLVEQSSNSKQESLLRYHRPILEDGRVAYEFYYDPGKVMVHPALDRLAFLLEADGVKVHWLTDGAFERTGLQPDNRREEAENRRGPASLPLKPKAWNRLVLSLSADRVGLELNDQAIYERALEATNQRSFGLFHYAGETQARLRNVTYQGNWPRSLPASLRPAN